VNAYDVVRRLRAYEAGRPLPRGEALQIPLPDDDDLLIVAFLRMGGEALPWGVALGWPDRKPDILTVAEPRNRDLVAGIMVEFAPRLLAHLRHPNHSDDAISGPEHRRPLRQVWLPNVTHLEMLHHLAYAYTFAQRGAAERLNELGRAANWLFQEAQRPGQVTVMVAADVLRNAFTVPAEDARQGHLGFLLAWLGTPGGRDARHRAATEAERRSIATNLDPDLERDSLEKLVTQWNEGRDRPDQTARAGIERQIEKLLRPELERRFELTRRALRLLRDDPRRVNGGVPVLEEASRSEHWYRYLRIERQIHDPADGPPFVPSPETDRHTAAAAARFFTHEESEEVAAGALIHDDREVQADAIAAGDAFRGQIVEIQDEGNGRSSIPVWTLADEHGGPLRLREGSAVCVVGLPGRTGTIRDIKQAPNGSRRFEVEITSWKRARTERGRRVPAADDPSLRGLELVMVAKSEGGLSRRKGQKVWNHNVPGAWLTHATAVPTGVVSRDDVAGEPGGGDED
jgi:hypothetical protein